MICRSIWLSAVLSGELPPYLVICFTIRLSASLSGYLPPYLVTCRLIWISGALSGDLPPLSGYLLPYLVICRPLWLSEASLDTWCPIWLSCALFWLSGVLSGDRSGDLRAYLQRLSDIKPLSSSSCPVPRAMPSVAGFASAAAQPTDDVFDRQIRKASLDQLASAPVDVAPRQRAHAARRKVNRAKKASALKEERKADLVREKQVLLQALTELRAGSLQPGA